MDKNLTDCQKRLVDCLSDKYCVDSNGQFKCLKPFEPETSLEFFIIETYGE